MKFLIKD